MMISDPKYIYIPIQKDKPDNDFGPIKIQSRNKLNTIMIPIRNKTIIITVRNIHSEIYIPIQKIFRSESPDDFAMKKILIQNKTDIDFNP